MQSAGPSWQSRIRGWSLENGFPVRRLGTRCKADIYLKTQLQNVDLEIGDLIGLIDQLRESTYFMHSIDLKVLSLWGEASSGFERLGIQQLD